MARKHQFGVFLLLTLASLASPHLTFSQLIEVPPELGAVSWDATPVAVAASVSDHPAVVWLGSVESVSATAKEGQVEVEWVCRFLQIAEPGPNAIAGQFVRYLRSDGGYFVVNLVMQAPPEAVGMLQTQLEDAGRYILAVGRAEALVSRSGHEAVFLTTAKMLQADEIAEPVGN